MAAYIKSLTFTCSTFCSNDIIWIYWTPSRSKKFPLSISDRKDVTQVLMPILGQQNHFNIWCMIIEICGVLKVASAIFYQMFIVHQIIALQKL